MATKKAVLFITENKGKLKEAQQILGDGFEVTGYGEVDLPEIQTTDVKEVIHEKVKVAKAYFDSIDVSKLAPLFKHSEVKSANDIIVICEDTGFHIDGTQKHETEKTKVFPGALIKFYWKALGSEELIKRDAGSTARVACYIGVIINGHIREPIEGIVEGELPDSLRGTGGFGWDPCFIPKPRGHTSNTKTYAELTEEEKNEISHRAVAFKKLAHMLTRTGGKRTRRLVRIRK